MDSHPCGLTLKTALSGCRDPTCTQADGVNRHILPGSDEAQTGQLDVREWINGDPGTNNGTSIPYAKLSLHYCPCLANDDQPSFALLRLAQRPRGQGFVPNNGSGDHNCLSVHRLVYVCCGAQGKSSCCSFHRHESSLSAGVFAARAGLCYTVVSRM